MAQVRTTTHARFEFDIELRHPHDADALYALGNVMEDVLKQLRSVRTAARTAIVPAEPNFDWQGR